MFSTKCLYLECCLFALVYKRYPLGFSLNKFQAEIQELSGESFCFPLSLPKILSKNHESIEQHYYSFLF